MTPDQITQLRQNAFLIRSIADNDEDKQLKGEPEACFPRIKRLADQILALLPCSTCNGTKKALIGGRAYGTNEPCPDCK